MMRDGQRTFTNLGVGLLESAGSTGGTPHPILNMDGNPIAYKYREGKVKRTPERGLKVLETLVVEAICTRYFLSKNIAYHN